MRSSEMAIATACAVVFAFSLERVIASCFFTVSFEMPSSSAAWGPVDPSAILRRTRCCPFVSGSPAKRRSLSSRGSVGIGAAVEEEQEDAVAPLFAHAPPGGVAPDSFVRLAERLCTRCGATRVGQTRDRRHQAHEIVIGQQCLLLSHTPSAKRATLQPAPESCEVNRPVLPHDAKKPALFLNEARFSAAGARSPS
jgi:hypothetical protein